MADCDSKRRKHIGSDSSACPDRVRGMVNAIDVDDGRHFKNEFSDDREPAGWREMVHRAMDWAERDVCAARHEKSSIYTGEGGVVFALLHLANRGLHPNPNKAATEALRRLVAGEQTFSPSRVTLLEGRPGNVVLQICAQWRLGNYESAQESVQQLRKLAPRAMALEESECEVLYGRCGFLGAILMVRRQLGDPSILAEQATELVRGVLAAGKRSARSGWPLYYEWNGKCYYGGAHGIAGILLTLLQLPTELSAADPEAPELVRATAETLLSKRFRSGNLPSSAGSSNDRLIHFCHGATGLVPLLLRMAEYYADPKYMTMAAEVGDVVWARGLLKGKGLGLCHGIPGNGYALLTLHRATGEARWLHRAQHFAVFAAEHATELAPNADRPHSLFEGSAGALCFWADVIHSVSSAAAPPVLFPCYEF